jgi:hypothetical protein
MTFGDYIERARVGCRDVLLERIAQRRAGSSRVIVEPALRNTAGEIVSAPDGLKLPLRYDLAAQSNDGAFQTENTDSTTINFSESVFVTWEHTLRIEIQRLCWDYMMFEVRVDEAFDWEWLRQWFLKWFDLDDSRSADTDGLYDVVHFVSDPEIDGNTARFFVDFGSSSTDALADLFDALKAQGITQCTIGKT